MLKLDSEAPAPRLPRRADDVRRDYQPSEGRGKLDLSSIEACISGAAPLPVEVQTEFEQLTGGRLVEGYGLTEASPVTHANPIWGRRKEGSIGLPWPDTDCRIVDPETGEDVPVGERGRAADPRARR